MYLHLFMYLDVFISCLSIFLFICVCAIYSGPMTSKTGAPLLVEWLWASIWRRTTGIWDWFNIWLVCINPFEKIRMNNKTYKKMVKLNCETTNQKSLTPRLAVGVHHLPFPPSFGMTTDDNQPLILPELTDRSSNAEWNK